MINLVLKDIPIFKRIFIPALVLCLTGNCFFINTPALIYVVVPSFLAYNCIDASFGYDYKYNADMMFNSLPVLRREIVLSKYLDSIVFLILGAVLTYIFTYIFRAIGFPVSHNFVYMNKWMNLGSINNLMNIKSIIISCIVGYILMMSVFIPIYYKAQYLWVKSILAIVIFVIPVLLILAIKSIGYEKIFKFINYFSRVPGLVVSALGICILFLIAYISINLSVKFYESKDLK